MQKFYVTFGVGSVNRNRFCVVEAKTYEEARRKVVEYMHTHWAFLYIENEWVCNGMSQQEKWLLIEDTLENCAKRLQNSK